MAIKTLADLRTDAQVIKNEVTTGANTALRVGTFMDEFLESLDTIRGGLWEFTLDGTYTGSTQPLTIAAGVKTKITIDGGAQRLKSPNFVGDLWNTSTNKFTPLVENDFYSMRLAISGWSDIAAVNRFDVEFDVAGTSGVIGRETGVFAKGAGNAQSFNFVAGFFAGGDFLANGGEIYITPFADASFWEIAVTINRTYTPEV